MMKALTWMFLFSTYKWGYTAKTKKRFRFRINFITLTLSDAQFHSDDWIKIHMLEPFLKWLKRQGCRHYVWKAETQDNGNIHFHITTDHFIHYQKLREKWNNIQWKAGYLNYRQASGGDLDPNSTDVHAVKTEKGFVSYMTKYLMKDYEMRKQKSYTGSIQFARSPLEREVMMASIAAAGLSCMRRQVEGKIWACDKDLLNIRVSINENDSDFGDILSDHVDRMKATFRKHDFCETYRHKLMSMTDGYHPAIAERFATAYNQYHRKEKTE